MLPFIPERTHFEAESAGEASRIPPALLARLHAEGRRANPGVALPAVALEAQLLAYLAGRPSMHVDELDIGDLFLAAACARGVAEALSIFERRFRSVIRRAVSRVLPAPADREEAEQLVRLRLLVGGAESPPKIGRYLGTGPLESWIAVAAIRVAVSMSRSASAERRARRLAIDEETSESAELRCLRQESRAHLRTALERAVVSLDDEDRVLLRLRYAQGMTATAIGRTLEVTPQTASRRLARIRNDVRWRIFADLGSRLRITAREVRGMARLATSGDDGAGLVAMGACSTMSATSSGCEMDI